MTRVQQCFLIFLLSTCIPGNRSETFPFFVHADQVFVKCANGKLESFNGTTNIPSLCTLPTQMERVNVLYLYIQCPEGHLHLEFNRTFTASAFTPEYSIANLHPHCFIEQPNEQGNHNYFIPYQTRYTSDNSTFTQIISFQCEHNLSLIINERWRWYEQFYLFFKLMNYGLCRFSIQFTQANGKCHRFHQQMYKIHAQVKHSMCYYQLGAHPPEISLGYFDQLLHTNVSSDTPVVSRTNTINRSVMIMTASITGVSLFLSGVVFVAIYRCGLFRA